MDKLATVNELVRVIQLAARLVSKLPSNLQEAYHPDIIKLIEDYNVELSLLRKELEEYFKQEQSSGGAINLNLRRAYEELKFL